jgi:hypothetical protein
MIFNVNDVPFGDFKEYRKTATVQAIQLELEFAVNTLEGIMTGQPGDYLCEGIDGERWAVKKEIFEKTYEVTE